MYSSLISPTHALAHIGQPASALWLDARFELNRPQQGGIDFLDAHIATAQHIDLEKDLSSIPSGSNGRHPLPNAARLIERLRRLGMCQHRQVLIYDQGEMMYAARAWAMLRWLGHEAVAVIDGGLPALLQHGAVLTDAPTQPEKGDFHRQHTLLPLRHAADLQAASAPSSPHTLLVDARAGNRFAGEPHPLDPRCGHIPGACNRFFRHNLDACGRFLPAEVLHNQWQALLNKTPPHNVVHYCGSGVSACVNLLAMEYAGLNGSALYVGSWSEWAADSLRPIAHDN